MSANQYAVFHFDIKTMSMRDAAGNYLSSENDTPPIFNSLEEARAYSQQEIEAKPTLGCRIYDHQGQTIESFSNAEVYDRNHGLPSAKRNIAIGAACLMAGIGGVALDAWREWSLTFGVILGVRFLWVGSVKVIDGVAAWKSER
jgi:hypothetical protein